VTVRPNSVSCVVYWFVSVIKSTELTMIFIVVFVYMTTFAGKGSYQFLGGCAATCLWICL
jgi:hypothetical protein